MFCVDVSDEHTPINLPDSNWNFPHDYDVTIIATTEDLTVPRHSGAPNRSKHTAAVSGVPTVLGSPSNCQWKQLADNDSVDRRYSIMETCADQDRETVVSILFRPESKAKRDRDQNVVQSLTDRENLHKILERTLELAVRGEKMAQQKLFKAEAEFEARKLGKEKCRFGTL